MSLNTPYFGLEKSTYIKVLSVLSKFDEIIESCILFGSRARGDNKNSSDFDFAIKELDRIPAVVNFCKRQQGILIQKDNPKSITGIADLARSGIRMVNRALGTGTRLLLDHELKKADISTEKIEGYHNEVHRHLDVGLEILSGRVDAGPGIRAVAAMLDIGFLPLRWERYDLLISKERFFDEGTQKFLGLLHEDDFRQLVNKSFGYDLQLSGKMLYPGTMGSVTEED